MRIGVSLWQPAVSGEECERIPHFTSREGTANVKHGRNQSGAGVFDTPRVRAQGGVAHARHRTARLSGSELCTRNVNLSQSGYHHRRRDRFVANPISSTSTAALSTSSSMSQMERMSWLASDKMNQRRLTPLLHPASHERSSFPRTDLMLCDHSHCPLFRWYGVAIVC